MAQWAGTARSEWATIMIITNIAILAKETQKMYVDPVAPVS